MSNLLLIPYDSHTDPENSTEFCDSTYDQIDGGGIATMEDVAKAILENLKLREYYEGARNLPDEPKPGDKEIEGLYILHANKYAGAVVVHDKTLEQAHMLAASMTQYGISDDSHRDSRVEVVFHYCLMHAIRVIGDPPRDDLPCGSMLLVPQTVLVQAADALGTAVERYDCMGAYATFGSVAADPLNVEAKQVDDALKALREFE